VGLSVFITPAGDTAHTVVAVMTLSVDRIRCCGYGLCVAECPQMFEQDEDGLARVKLAVAPSELREAAERAALSCPEEAITIHESGSDQHTDSASGP
jgi:ferredoxin